MSTFLKKFLGRNDILEEVVFRLLASFILLAQFIIFLGLAIRGVIDFFSLRLPGDWIFAFGFLIVGALFSAITVQAFVKLWKKNSQKRLSSWLQKNKKTFIITLIAFVFLVIYKDSAESFVLYLGLTIGDAFIFFARLAYLELFGFDLNIFKPQPISWVFQWYFVSFLVGWVASLIKWWQNRFLKHKKDIL